MNLDFVTPTPVIDFHNANTLRYKVLELREATNYEIPIFLKAGGDMAGGNQVGRSPARSTW